MFDLLKSVQQEPSTTQLTGEAYAWVRLATLLHDHPDLSAMCRILHNVDRQYSEHRGFTIFDRELKDALRIVALAKRTLNELDPALVADAVEQTAIRIAEGINQVYGPWKDLNERVQDSYRRLAQSALNERDATLERAQ